MGTVGPYIPHTLTTIRLIPQFHVNVEPLHYSIPLEAAVKQGVPEDARTEPELKVVVAVSPVHESFTASGTSFDQHWCSTDHFLRRFVRDNVVLTLSGQLFFGVANFDGAGCGETLRTEGGHFRTLFFGPVLNYGADFATLSVVKVTLEVLVETNWSEDDVGLIELESQKGVISMAASLSRIFQWWNLEATMEGLIFCSFLRGRYRDIASFGSTRIESFGWLNEDFGNGGNA
ncbi:hypothetical protein V6N11_012870 [Hibiscus sabdariffa]